MSSHHIVREKQEPALLIMSLENFPSESLGQLLEWSPTVLTAEVIYEQADAMGIKVDGVVSNNPDFYAQEHTQIILTENEPLADALKYLIAEGYPAVNIIDSVFLLKEYVLFVDLINLVIFYPGSIKTAGVRKIFPVRQGFSKWRSAGEKVFLMHEVNHLQASGLKPIHHHELETEKDGFYTLNFDQPYIFIAEEI